MPDAPAPSPTPPAVLARTPTDLPAALWAALAPAQRDLLRQVAAAAGDAGSAAFLVGGPVRDLLLGATRLRDLDVMTTTDAREIAPLLAARVGGAVEKTTAFGTATVTLPAGNDPEALDLATTRTDTYARPGALPTVVFPAPTVADDLRRRDFTLNALALPLTRDGFGPLIDPYGGLDDVRGGRLRVLHAASFADDPTRLFRLARYAARYGFAPDSKTASLTSAAVQGGALATLSPARKRREIALGMQEQQPVACLAAFDRFGLLRATSPALVWDAWAAARIEKLAERAAPLWAFWAAFVVRQGEAAMRQLLSEVALIEAEVQRPIRALVRAYVAVAAGSATPDTALSTLAPLFAPLPEWVVPIFFPAPMAERVAALHAQVQAYAATPHLNGDDLLALGVPKGKSVGEMLTALRAAWLDGGLQTRTDEQHYVVAQVTK